MQLPYKTLHLDTIKFSQNIITIPYTQGQCCIHSPAGQTREARPGILVSVMNARPIYISKMNRCGNIQTNLAFYRKTNWSSSHSGPQIEAREQKRRLKSNFFFPYICNGSLFQHYYASLFPSLLHSTAHPWPPISFRRYPSAHICRPSASFDSTKPPSGTPEWSLMFTQNLLQHNGPLSISRSSSLMRPTFHLPHFWGTHSWGVRRKF